ncbi:BTAD domain-containing putative transcriptional regulator [Plantactinospora sp. B5E13]|uniref:AfsR/SARP family transcriptional regulator n=1 Tax=unclassified Plantactinospora TaxID=2631981 RepID=UPI00325F3DD5
MVGINTKTAGVPSPPASDDGAGGTTVAFRILGPLEIQGRASPVTPPGARQRVVLATLLLRANTVVPMEKIIHQVWPHHVPPTAREQVPIVVAGLRRLLRDAGTPRATEVLLTRRPGYLIRLAPAQLDAHRFESLLGEADRALAVDRREDAIGLLESALSLWRGHPLTGVPSGQASIEAQRLTELRLRAMEKLFDAQLASGRHRQLVPRLSQLVAAHPLRERLRGQLMIALHAVGRRAEALETYRVGRRLTVAELGLEPGTELRRIEQALLADTVVHSIAEVNDTSPVTTTREPAARHRTALPSAWPVPPPPALPAQPAQLPADLRDFTGRGPEIDGVRRAIDEAGPGTPLVAVTGPPGVGKSVLATHLGHLLRDRFPDGQLHVALHGGGPGEIARSLASLVASFGVPPATIPADIAEQVRMFRAVTAGRRVLVVVDDAADPGDGWLFHPGGPGCAVLVTSRFRPPGSAGVRHVPIDAPPADEALALLARIVGPDRVAAESQAAARIVDCCGRLPLAVRIAGARLATRPHWSLTTLARRLAPARRRLDELRVEDLDVRATLESAVRCLPPRVELLARRLAQRGGPDVSSRAAAAVLGSSVETAEELLDPLVRHHVLVPAHDAASTRYRLPTLTRLYLRERSPRSLAAGQAPEV